METILLILIFAALGFLGLSLWLLLNGILTVLIGIYEAVQVLKNTQQTGRAHLYEIQRTQVELFAILRDRLPEKDAPK